MPKYDYHCPTCDQKFEDVWVSSFRDAVGSPRPCHQCQTPMTRLVSAPNFSIKGFSEKNGYGSR